MRDSVQKNLRLTNFRFTANRRKQRERRLVVWPMGMVLTPLTPLAPVQSRLRPSLPRRNKMKAGAFSISAFAFPLSGAHSPHGDKSCRQTELATL